MPGLVDAHNHVGEVHTLLMQGWLDTPITGIVDAWTGCIGPPITG